MVKVMRWIWHEIAEIITDERGMTWLALLALLIFLAISGIGVGTATWNVFMAGTQSNRAIQVATEDKPDAELSQIRQDYWDGALKQVQGVGEAMLSAETAADPYANVNGMGVTAFGTVGQWMTEDIEKNLSQFFWSIDLDGIMPKTTIPLTGSSGTKKIWTEKELTEKFGEARALLWGMMQCTLHGKLDGYTVYITVDIWALKPRERATMMFNDAVRNFDSSVNSLYQHLAMTNPKIKIQMPQNDQSPGKVQYWGLQSKVPQTGFFLKRFRQIDAVVNKTAAYAFYQMNIDGDPLSQGSAEKEINNVDNNIVKVMNQAVQRWDFLHRPK